jgi:hypothetical protein
MNQGNINENAILLADSHHGIYIPKIIAEDIISGNLKVTNKEDILWGLSELGDPDNEHYWEAWEDLCNNAVLVDKTGNEYYIYQDDDVWAIPSKEAPYIEEW